MFLISTPCTKPVTLPVKAPLKLLAVSVFTFEISFPPAFRFPPSSGVVSDLTSACEAIVYTFPLTLVLAPAPPSILSVPPSASCILPVSETTFNCCKPPVAFIVIPVVELVSVMFEP